jgi:hypothetical protein
LLELKRVTPSLRFRHLLHPFALKQLAKGYVFGGKVTSSRNFVAKLGKAVPESFGKLEINGHAARVTLRWRFDSVTSVTLGDTPLEVHTDAGGRYVEFNYTNRSMVQWK